MRRFNFVFGVDLQQNKNASQAAQTHTHIYTGTHANTQRQQQTREKFTQPSDDESNVKLAPQRRSQYTWFCCF